MRSLRREDGVALFYEEAEGDDPPVLLVHGIACDHTIFAPQFEHFARKGQRVVAVDLRGHGKTVGSGHFCQLEVPEQVNAMIDRFLASTLPT
jgi:pimeloyl-ACP methyl ester carboxylesterase